MKKELVICAPLEYGFGPLYYQLDLMVRSSTENVLFIIKAFLLMKYLQDIPREMTGGTLEVNAIVCSSWFLFSLQIQNCDSYKRFILGFLNLRNEGGQLSIKILVKLPKFATFGPLILNVMCEESLVRRGGTKCSFWEQLIPRSKKRRHKLQQITGCFPCSSSYHCVINNYCVVGQDSRHGICVIKRNHVCAYQHKAGPF